MANSAPISHRRAYSSRRRQALIWGNEAALDPAQQDLLAIPEKWWPFPQPGDQRPVLDRLRAGRGTTGRPAQERLNINGGCTHLDRIHGVTPTSWGGEDSLAHPRQGWVHLRGSQECGHVGRCDNPPGRHATAHFNSAGRPALRSYEPGEDWYWCYLDKFAFEPEGAPPGPWHP
jgi:hypothetical protein